MKMIPSMKPVQQINPTSLTRTTQNQPSVKDPHQHQQPRDSTNKQNIDFDNNFEHFDKIFDTLTLEIDKNSDSEHNNNKNIKRIRKKKKKNTDKQREPTATN